MKLTGQASLGLASYQVVTVGNTVSAISLSWRSQITLHFRPHYPQPAIYPPYLKRINIYVISLCFLSSNPYFSLFAFFFLTFWTFILNINLTYRLPIAYISVHTHSYKFTAEFSLLYPRWVTTKHYVFVNLCISEKCNNIRSMYRYFSIQLTEINLV